MQTKKNAKVFHIQKSGHFAKNQDSLRYVLYTKSRIFYVTQFFMNFSILEFLYKKHETLRYMTFLYTKSQTLRKNQDNLRHVFIYKNLDTLYCTIFLWIFEIGGGGEIFLYAKNNAFCFTFFFQKRMHLPLCF